MKLPHLSINDLAEEGMKQAASMVASEVSDFLLSKISEEFSVSFDVDDEEDAENLDDFFRTIVANSVLIGMKLTSEALSDDIYENPNLDKRKLAQTMAEVVSEIERGLTERN